MQSHGNFSLLAGLFLLWTILHLPVVNIAVETNRNVEVLALLPLTGPEELRGRAQHVGIHIAIEDTMKSNASLIDFAITFHDTQVSVS